ncbi:MAG: PP2C family protein-serine/threonine phosphatase [Ekhidna sp.]|nr:PP2C family protein-serine/threonine phosphatase [Ekhidna sp.]
MRKTSLDVKDLQLNALLEVTQAVNNNLPEEDLLKIYRFTLLADLKVEKLALYGEENGRWICRAHFGTKTHFADQELPKKYLSLQKERVVTDDVFSEFESVFPVYHKDKLLAVVFLKSGLDDSKQNRFLNALTNIILVAIENKKLARKQVEQEAYKRELEIAKKVQNFLFPKELPKIERLQIEAFYLPHHDVGGDYYDYIQLNEDKFLICIADVSGKGVPAALLMSNFQASLRALVRQSGNLEEIVTELNLTTYRSGNAENFITFFMAVYDFKEQSLEYINCGHNEIILKSNGKIQMLTEGTTVLGMLNPLPFIESKKIENLTDFFVFCYTDGLTETFNENDEPFEFERLKSIIEKENFSDINRLQHVLLDALQNFKGEGNFHDDITMLSCRVRNK